MRPTLGEIAVGRLEMSRLSLAPGGDGERRRCHRRWWWWRWWRGWCLAHIACVREIRGGEGEEEGAEVTGRGDSCDSLPWSRSPSLSLFALSPFLPFLHRLLPFSRSVANAQLRTPLATQLRAVPRTAAIVIRGISHVGITRAIYAICRPWSPLSSREARPLSVRREVSISRSLVRMPFPRHRRRRNAVFANLGALHPAKPISGSPSCYRACIRTSFRVPFLPSDFLVIRLSA